MLDSEQLFEKSGPLFEKTERQILGNEQDFLASIPEQNMETSNRSYKNESEDEYLSAARKRPITVQGVRKEEQESFNLLKSTESYENF